MQMLLGEPFWSYLSMIFHSTLLTTLCLSGGGSLFNSLKWGSGFGGMWDFVKENQDYKDVWILGQG